MRSSTAPTSGKQSYISVKNTHMNRRWQLLKTEVQGEGPTLTGRRRSSTLSTGPALESSLFSSSRSTRLLSNRYADAARERLRSIQRALEAENDAEFLHSIHSAPRAELTLPAKLSSITKTATTQPKVSGRPDNEGGAIKPLKKRSRVRRKSVPIAVCLTNCKYPTVREQCMKAGLVEVGEEGKWDIFWTDTSVSQERVMRLNGLQKINHFPSMVELSRKEYLARNMRRMKIKYKNEFDFFPNTWQLPADMEEFKGVLGRKTKSTYIVKPNNMCQGRGIFLVKTLAQFEEALEKVSKETKKAAKRQQQRNRAAQQPAHPHDFHRNPAPKVAHNDRLIVQEYIDKPFLIDGYKFDLRLYVLVTSVTPLRVFLYKEGLARFCTEPYQKPTANNIDNSFIHLTNYAINKASENFVDDEEYGSKRTVGSVMKYIDETNGNSNMVWKRICRIICKSLVVVQPVLERAYNDCFSETNNGFSCFEILGFDILLDHYLRPWLLEINHSPSFSCDAEIDKNIKEPLLQDTLALVSISSKDKRRFMIDERNKMKERLYVQRDASVPRKNEDERKSKRMTREMMKEREDECMGSYMRIYPADDAADDFDSILESAEHPNRPPPASAGGMIGSNPTANTFVSNFCHSSKFSSRPNSVGSALGML